MRIASIILIAGLVACTASDPTSTHSLAEQAPRFRVLTGCTFGTVQIVFPCDSSWTEPKNTSGIKLGVIVKNNDTMQHHIEVQCLFTSPITACTPTDTTILFAAHQQKTIPFKYNTGSAGTAELTPDALSDNGDEVGSVNTVTVH